MTFPCKGLIRSLPFIAAGLIGFSGPGYAQRLQSTVTLTLELLPLEKQEKLKDFAGVLETYINEYDWTGQDFGEPLTLTINLQLQEASSSFEDRYSGIFMITNNTDMQYYDKYWRFPYSSEVQLEHGGSYHPLSGFIDFYIEIILGGEYDKLGLKAGDIYYEKARQVADQAAFDTQFSSGWKERTELIAWLIGEENQLFREMKDRYYLGLSYVNEDDELVRTHCMEAVTLLENVLNDNPDHKDAINFLKAHHLEIIEIFSGDAAMLRRMIRLDPDRADTYRQYMP